MQIIIKPGVVNLSFWIKKDVSIFYINILIFVIFLAKTLDKQPVIVSFYLCYSPQKTVLTFSSLQVAEKSSHARTVQTSDYSAMALKVLLLSDKRKKFASQIFSFVAPNSQPHVY